MKIALFLVFLVIPMLDEPNWMPDPQNNYFSSDSSRHLVHTENSFDLPDLLFNCISVRSCTETRNCIRITVGLRNFIRFEYFHVLSGMSCEKCSSLKPRIVFSFLLRTSLPDWFLRQTGRLKHVTPPELYRHRGEQYLLFHHRLLISFSFREAVDSPMLLLSMPNPGSCSMGGCSSDPFP